MAILKDLPPELLHEIFAFMQDERPLAALIACSVVSRLWRDITLPQLFFTFKTPRTESFTDVVRFLSTHAHIAACVKHLCLQRTRPVFPNPESLKSLPKPEIDHHTVHALLERLPALKTLYFQGVKFVGPRIDAHVVPSGSRFASSAAPPPATTNTHALPDDLIRPYHLQWVVLHSCTVPHDPTPLFRILSLCDIDKFQVMLTQFPDEPLEPTALHRTLRIRRLWLGSQSRWKLEPLLEALQRCLEPGCVRELNVGCNNWQSIKSVGALLRDVGRNLTVLELRLFWGADTVKDMTPQRWGVLNLSSCTALETFHFLPFTFMRNGTGISPGTVCADIARSLAPSVRTIVLGLGVFVDAGSECAESLGLGKLDKAVMEDRQWRFPELARVTLQFAKKDELEAWATISRRAMPRLERAGLLQVTCGGL